MRERTKTTTFELFSTNLCHILESDPVSFLVHFRKNQMQFNMHNNIFIKVSYKKSIHQTQPVFCFCAIIMIYLDVNVYKSEGLCVQEETSLVFFETGKFNVCFHCDTRPQRVEGANFKHLKQSKEKNRVFYEIFF